MKTKKTKTVVVEEEVRLPICYKDEFFTYSEHYHCFFESSEGVLSHLRIRTGRDGSSISFCNDDALSISSTFKEIPLEEFSNHLKKAAYLTADYLDKWFDNVFKIESHEVV